MSVEHREVIDRLVNEVMNRGRLDVIDDLYTPGLAAAARRWIAPFLASFSDVDMRVVEVVTEGDRAAARFSCSGTHTGVWQGHAPTGRRFVNVAEVYFFRFESARIARAWGLEDNVTRLRHLGLPSDTASLETDVPSDRAR